MMSIPKNLTAAIIISIASFVFWALVLPSYNSLPVLQAAIKERGDLLASRQATLSRISSLIGEYQKRTEDLQKISTIVPEKPNTAELITALDDVTTKSGLQLQSLTLNVEGGDVSTNTTSNYNTLSIETDMTGDYNAAFAFLANLEKSLRLIDMTTFSIVSPQDAKGITSLKFSIKANAYFLKSAEEIAKANAQNQKNKNAQSIINSQ